MYSICISLLLLSIVSIYLVVCLQCSPKLTVSTGSIYVYAVGSGDFQNWQCFMYFNWERHLRPLLYRISDTRDRGQPACHEDPKEWKEKILLFVWMWCIIDINDVECLVRNSPCMLLRKFRREKTLGEMWAAVIRTINNLLRTVWLWTCAPNWGQSRSQLMLRRGPCWTYSRGASRRR